MMSWDDELRTIKIAILSVAFNREQLEAFQRLFEAFFLFSKPMKLRSLLKMYLPCDFMQHITKPRLDSGPCWTLDPGLWTLVSRLQIKI